MKQIIIRFLIVFSIVCVAVLIFLTMAGCTGIPGEIEHNIAGNDQSSISTLVETINAEMKKKKITGLAISVADSYRVLWAEGFGRADKKNDIPFTDNTISNVGSVSKLLTATAIMRLVEMEMVDLDTPVSTYIPEFNPRGMETTDTPITVRMLMNHESGLESDAYREFYLGNETPEDFPYSYRRAIDALNVSGIVRKPYEIFSYCNLGYSLLGVIAERAVGGSFQDAMKELVFEPLGMNDSTFNMDEVTESSIAMGYVGGRPREVPYIRDMPAGSLNTTAQDMGSFMCNMLASYRSEVGLLTAKTMKEMFTPSNSGVTADLDFKIGLTWWDIDFEKLPGEYIVGHGGDLPPFHSVLLLVPERNLSVFVMVNSVDGTGSFSLADIVAETVRTFAQSKGQSDIPPTPETSPIVELPSEIRETLPGYYASTAGLSEIKLSGSKLKMYAFNQWLDVYYHADNTLTLGYKLLGIIPLNIPVFDELSVSLEDSNGTPAVNLRLQGVLISPALKIEPVPIDTTWLERCGAYEDTRSEVMPQYTDFKINVDSKSGFLCFYTKSDGEWSKFPLETKDSSTAQLMGTGRSLGSLIHATAGETGEVLRYLNFELRRKNP